MDAKAVGQYFDERADGYTHDVDPEGLESSPIADGFVAGNCSGDDRLLEIGCGDGLFLEYVLAETDVAEAYGIDISSAMLPGGDDARATYVRASATDYRIPFQEGTFDFVVFRDVLHHLVADSRTASKLTAQAVLEEAATLLKPGGYLILKDIYDHSPVGPQTLTPSAIFYGLKYFDDLVSKIEPQAVPGLLVSFYTREELLSLVRRAGVRIVDEEIEERPPESLPIRLFSGESGCIRLYAETTDSDRTRD